MIFCLYLDSKALNLTLTHFYSDPARTRAIMKDFGAIYEQQYAVALFNSVRYEIEGGGTPQTQLLHRKVQYITCVNILTHISFISTFRF